MRYIFFGTPRFAAIALQKLIDNKLVPVAIICNPDRPVGRKKILKKPETKIIAEKYSIPVFQPANKKELTALTPTLKKLDVDLGLVAAYAQIIEDEVLSVPKNGTLGIHPSLLPAYRGSTPIQSVLLSGEIQTGTTIYQMDKEVDHGPVIAQEKLQIERNETYLSLEKKLSSLGADLVIQNYQGYLNDEVKPITQDHDSATFTKKFKTSDAEVVFGKDKDLDIYRKIQALNPEPGVWTINFPTREGRRVKLLAATFTEDKLKITQIQPDGKTVINL